jgi:hypothetical protein
MKSTNKSMKLTRTDGKTVDVVFYNNSNIKNVEILNIKQLKFEGKKAKDITKSNIRDIVFKGKDKLYIQNNVSKMVAGLSKKHLNKIISTVFTKDTKGKYGYLKKEIVSNVDTIFYAAIPILKHNELKKQALYNNQIIHRLAVPLKIGGLIFLIMMTVKERSDYKELAIDEFSIYDLYSEVQCNKKPLGSPSTVSKRTFRSQYQMVNYSINDLINFVKMSMTKIQ